MELAGRRIAEQLAEAIEERIATGQYPPGTRLDESDLAANFGVSRTPIREALIRLSGSRMLEKRSRKGWVVAEMSPHRLFDMFEVMAELEAFCARLAASRGTSFLKEKIRAAHEACRGVSDPDAYFRLNEAFHQTLYRACQNEFLIEEALAVQRLLRPYRRLQLRVRSRLQTSFEEHQGIVDAIVGGDAEAAGERVRAHVTVQGTRYTDLVASLEKLTSKSAGGLSKRAS
jgi:DNA-binding GntR family transcriptional regulator